MQQPREATSFLAAKPPRRQGHAKVLLSSNLGDRRSRTSFMFLQRIEPPAHLDKLANRVIGAAIDVHRALGAGHAECVYERALCIELTEVGIPFRSQVKVPVAYRGITVGEGQLDILVDDELVIELKAVERLLLVHRAQVISYLKAADLHLGLLMNFNVPLLKDGIQRVIMSP
jgi:GxxExxY protein